MSIKHTTRTYVIAEDPLRGLLDAVHRIGLMDAQPFLIADYEHCLIWCVSAADQILVHSLLSNLPCPIIPQDTDLLAPEIWRNEVADEIERSPYTDSAYVLSFCDLTLPSMMDHNQVCADLLSQGIIFDIR